MRSDDFAHPTINDQRADAGIDKCGIVGDERQVSDAGFKQGFHKAGRVPTPIKPPTMMVMPSRKKPEAFCKLISFVFIMFPLHTPFWVRRGNSKRDARIDSSEGNSLTY